MYDAYQLIHIYFIFKRDAPIEADTQSLATATARRIRYTVATALCPFHFQVQKLWP